MCSAFVAFRQQLLNSSSGSVMAASRSKYDVDSNCFVLHLHVIRVSNIVQTTGSFLEILALCVVLL